ncbi:MAG: hypothetical protein HUU19_14855 [Phycisphaerales bacterium]|nr:hypothetical protein [Phycisphaerales bacterium]
MATTWYVEDTIGNDLAAGTKAAPFKTLAKAQAVLASGDTVRARGQFREPWDVTDKSNVTLTNWDDFDAPWPVIRGDTVITGAWTSTSNHWNINIGAGKNIVSVVVNWDTSADAQGRNYGHVKLAADEATVDGTNNSWFYNSGTGVMSWRGSSPLEDPATLTIAWCKGGVDGVRFIGSAGTCDNIVVRRVKSVLWSDKTAGLGYCFKLQNCRNSLLDDCIAQDSGYHGFGFISYGANKNEGNYDRNIISKGGHVQMDSGHVYYHESSLKSGSFYATIHCYPLLGRDGNPVPVTGVTNATGNGFAIHTNGTAKHAAGAFTSRGMKIVHYDTAPTFTNRINSIRTSDANQPSDELDESTYPIWFDRSKIVNGVWSQLNSGGAFTRAEWSFDQAGPSGAATAGVVGDNASIPDHATILYKGCFVVANLDNAGGTYLIQARGNTGTAKTSKVIGVNSTFWNSGTSGSTTRSIFSIQGSATGSVRMIQNVFGHRTASATNYLVINDGSVGGPAHAFSDNVYWNIGTARWSGNTSYDTQAEWLSAIDPTMIVPTVAPLEDVTGASPRPPIAMWSQRKFVSSLTHGVNGARYNGNYGCWQVPPPGRPRRGSRASISRPMRKQ